MPLQKCKSMSIPLQMCNKIYTIKTTNSIIKVKNKKMSHYRNNSIKTSQKEAKSIPLTQIYPDHSFSWLGTSINIKSGGNKLVLWLQTGVLCEISIKKKIVETNQDEEKTGQQMVQYTQFKEDRVMHYISVRTYSTHFRSDRILHQ